MRLSTIALSVFFALGMPIACVTSQAVQAALEAAAAAAKEGHRETPLPADVRLMAPGSEVPEAFARFAGAWTGQWEDSGELCHTLVVEEVLANGYARVLSSMGTSVTLSLQLPGFQRVTGRIVDGILRFHGPGPHRPELNSSSRHRSGHGQRYQRLRGRPGWRPSTAMRCRMMSASAA